MAGILIGDDECPIVEIVKVFLKPAMEATMVEKWKTFATALQIPYSTVKKLSKDLIIDKITHSDIVTELLINWRSQNGSKATIENLMNTVIENFVWEEIEDFLRGKIQHNAKQWDDLDYKSKERILSCKVSFLGKEQTLNSIKSVFKGNDFSHALKEHIDYNFIQQALNIDIISLDSVMLPDQLAYYINRTLKWKRKVHPAVFQSIIKDIFVFEGLQRHQLSILAQPELTDTSGNQLDNLNVRFILLECENDFRELVKQAKVPIHRLEYQDEFYYWRFTAGSLKNVQLYLLENETEDISEQSLVEEHLTTFCSRPVAIVSSPGLGKSVLLGNLAWRVQQQFPHRIVLFLEMGSFFQHRKDTLESTSLHTIKDFIASYVTNCNFGRTLIRKLLENDENQFEVFLDGFDEIPVDQIIYAKRFLKSLLDSKNIRAHITSRPHLGTELEITLGVISFDIVPFQETDQKTFLCGFWVNQLDIENAEMLPTLASLVIKEISSDFIGIPFQCFLLAQIYSKVAQRYSTLDTDLYQIPNPSKSIFDLYNKFFEIKYQTVVEDERNFIKRFHWVEALKLLCPENELCLGICSELLKENIDIISHLQAKIYAVGIMQAGKTTDSPIFVHRSLAEFLVGEFICGYLEGNLLSSSEMMTPFIYGAILGTCLETQDVEIENEFMEWVISTTESSCWWTDEAFKAQNMKMLAIYLQNVSITPVALFGESLRGYLDLWRFSNGPYATLSALVRALDNTIWTEILDDINQNASKYAKASAFVNDGVCFFLNEDLARKKVSLAEVSHAKMHHKIYQQNTGNQLFQNGFGWTCLMTKKCYKHLLTELPFLFYDEQEKFFSYSECKKLLNISARYGNVEIFQCCCEIVDKFGERSCSKFNVTNVLHGSTGFECTPLHCALKSGNYKLTEYLITYYEDTLAEMNFLYQFILNGSVEDSTDVIKNKFSIILLLKSKNILLDVESFRKYFEWHKIDAELFIFVSGIIDYSPIKEDERNITFAFVDSIKNSFQMNLYVEWLESKEQTSFLSFRDGVIVKTAMIKKYLQPETFTKICQLRVLDLSLMINNAIKSDNAEEFAKSIVYVSGNVNIANLERRTMLHFASIYKKPNVIRYLLSVGADVNAVNRKGLTALDYARLDEENYSFNLTQECIDLLVPDTIVPGLKSAYSDVLQLFFWPHTCQIKLQYFFIEKVIIFVKHAYPFLKNSRRNNLLSTNLYRLHYGTGVRYPLLWMGLRLFSFFLENFRDKTFVDVDTASI